MKLPYITLSGSFSAMGEKFGRSFSTEIKQASQFRAQRIANFVKEQIRKTISAAEVIEIASQMLDAHQNYCPEIWEEFMGIASGAQIAPAQLLVNMAYTDLRDYVMSVQAPENFRLDKEGCTAFVVPAHLTKPGRVLCGQTWDMFSEALDFLVVVRRQPENYPETLCLTTFGCLPLIGVNSAGIAVGTTNLLPKDPQLGVNYLFTLTRALMAEDLGQAAAWVRDTPRLSGHSFMLADEKTGLIIETTARQAVCRRALFHALVQTNHYQDPQLAALQVDLPKKDVLQTGYRQGRGLEILNSRLTWDLAQLWEEFLGDTTTSRLGGVICDENLGPGLSATVATCAMDPQQRTLWLAAKGARGHRPEVYQLEGMS